MWDVFRFAWFAVRTFCGVFLLILALYAALRAFVSIHSALAPSADPDAALKRVMSYNARGGVRADGRATLVSPAARNDCSATRVAACDRH